MTHVGTPLFAVSALYPSRFSVGPGARGMPFIASTHQMKEATRMPAFAAWPLEAPSCCCLGCGMSRCTFDPLPRSVDVSRRNIDDSLVDQHLCRDLQALNSSARVLSVTIWLV